jgi:methionine-rich copper-binding protein CopC
MTPRSPGLRAALLVGALITLAMPLAASAHSEFVSSIPADKSTVSGTPAEIILTFNASLDPKKSSIILLDSSSSQVAKAGVDAADDKVMRMTPPTLQPGAYEIDWTSVALDGDLLRGKVAFTVTAPTPTDAPTTTPSAAASPTSTASAVPTPSSAPSVPPTPTSTSGADAIVPVLVAIVLIAVLGAWLLRGRMRGGPR